MSAIDVSGPALTASFEGTIPEATIGGFETDLVEEFFRAVANNARLTLHVRLLAGTNAHHMIEAAFKAFARALRAGGRDRRLASPGCRRPRACCERGPRIAIIDYGMGNLRSVEKALERAGARRRDHRRPRQDPRADGARAARRGRVPEGDGATCATSSSTSLIARAASPSGMPMLGICLGMQLLFETSTENDGSVGARPARAAACDGCRAGLKVPHIGWNIVKWQRPHRAGRGAARRVPVLLRALATRRCASHGRRRARHAEYGERLRAARSSVSNVYGVQFHPEKSSVHGLRLLRNFTRSARPSAPRPRAPVPASIPRSTSSAARRCGSSRATSTAARSTTTTRSTPRAGGSPRARRGCTSSTSTARAKASPSTSSTSSGSRERAGVPVQFGGGLRNGRGGRRRRGRPARIAW